MTNIVIKEYAIYCDVVSNLTDKEVISSSKSQVAATTTQDDIESTTNTTTDASLATTTIYDVAAEDTDVSSVPRTTSNSNTVSDNLGD